MNDKTQKSHLADYIDSMMKSKSSEFYSKMKSEHDVPIQSERNILAFAKLPKSDLGINPSQGDASHDKIDEGIDEPSGASNGQAIDMPNGSPTGRSTVESVAPSIYQPIAESIATSLDDPFAIQNQKEILLNETQYLLYYSIKEINGKLTNLNKISLQLGISGNTLKSALKKIKEKKTINYHGRDNRLGLHGFRAHAIDCPISLVGTDLTQIKRKLRLIDFDAMCLETSTNNPFCAQSTKHRMLHPMDQPSEDSSSSIDVNNKELLREIEDYFELNPDLEFWKNENLPPQIVLKWINEFNIHPDLMILYLSRCAFDVIQNKKVPSKTSITNFFYGCLKKVGCYLNPTGYLTIEERRLSELKKIVEEKDRVLHEIQELESRHKKAELELNFRKMMEDKTSELYRRCYSSIIPMFRKNEESPGFLAEMKKSYEKIVANNQVITSRFENLESADTDIRDGVHK